MSVSGISGSSTYSYSSQDVQNRMKQVQQEFQQLGQDLQSGNLSAAQTDFTSLQQLDPQISSGSSSSNPISQQFSQLASDLQSGNLSGAQQDFASIQQSMQNRSAHGHHHHGGDFSQLFNQLGQALQSGNLSSAQQIFSTLQTDMQGNSAAATAGSNSTTNSISLTA